MYFYTFFIYTYFKKIQITFLKLLHQMGLLTLSLRITLLVTISLKDFHLFKIIESIYDIKKIKNKQTC